MDRCHSLNKKIFIEPRKFVPFIFFSIISFLAVYLTWVALFLKVDLFDTYGLFLNARQILEGYQPPYYWKGTAALSTLYACFFWVGKIFTLNGLGVVAARISAVVFFLGLIMAAFRFFRLGTSASYAWFGAMLLALNPLLIHYAPFPKEDIPGAFFLTMAFYAYFQWEQRGAHKNLIFGILWAGIAMVMRNNLFAVIPGVMFLYECQRFFSSADRPLVGPFISRLFKGTFFFLILPLLVCMIFPALVYGLLGRVSGVLAPLLFLKEIVAHVRILNSQPETHLEAYAFLLRSCGWPILVLSMVGMAMALIRKEAFGKFCFIWFWTVFLLQAHVIQHREARFFFSAYVPLYFFTIKGVAEIFGLGKRLFCSCPEKFRGAQVLSAAVLLFFSIQAGGAECLKFQEPFYKRAFAQAVSDYALRLAGSHQIVWVGPMYPYHPDQYFFHPQDESTYIFHIYNHTLRFFTGRRVQAIASVPITLFSSRGPVLAKRIFPFLKDQDVLVINPEEKISTADVPSRLGPLFVQKVRKKTFGLMGTEGSCSYFLRSAHEREAGFMLCKDEKGPAVLKGWGLTDGLQDIFMVSQKGGDVFPEFLLKPQAGKVELHLNLGKGFLPEAVHEIGLLSYEGVRLFYPGASSLSREETTA